MAVAIDQHHALVDAAQHDVQQALLLREFGGALGDTRLEPAVQRLQRALCGLQCGDVVPSDDDAFDAAVLRAVRRGAALVAAPVAVAHVALDRLQPLQHRVRVGGEVAVGRDGREVDCQATDVRVPQMQQCGGRGGESPDAQPAIEKDGGDVRAGKQVVQVVVRRLQLAQPLLQLAVGPLQR